MASYCSIVSDEPKTEYLIVMYFAYKRAQKRNGGAQKYKNIVYMYIYCSCACCDIM